MARSVSFIIEGVIDTRITVTETADGGLLFEVEALDGANVGDLCALFFDLSDLVANGALSIAGGDVTAQAFAEASVSSVGGDANVNGDVVKELGRFDVGVAFGTPGAGRDDIRKTSFTLSHATERLTLDMLSGADFGLRYTSVGSEGGVRTGGAKIGGAAPVIGADDALAVAENGTATLNLLANDGLAPGAAITGFTLNGVEYAAGTVATLVEGGREIGAVSVAADGTATLEATGPDADALRSADSLQFLLFYTAQTGGEQVVGSAAATVTGVNDAPGILAESVATGLVTPDGAPTAAGQLVASDAESDALSWSGSAAGLYGAFAVNEATGAWTYTLSPRAYEARFLFPEETLTETFDVAVSDGELSDVVAVTVTIGRDADSFGRQDFFGREFDSAGLFDNFIRLDGDRLGGGRKYGDFEELSPGQTTLFGDTTIVGGDANQRLAGDLDVLIDNIDYDVVRVRVQIGDDSIKGGAGHDTITGDIFSANFTALDFTDDSLIIFGSDLILGGDGDDVIWGDARSIDTISLGFSCGADILVGGAGNDILWGDVQVNNAGGVLALGADVSVFEPGSGLDVIGDFDPSDRIDVAAYGFTSLADLLIETGPAGTVIDFDGTPDDIDEVLLANFFSPLTKANFVFA